MYPLRGSHVHVAPALGLAKALLSGAPLTQAESFSHTKRMVTKVPHVLLGVCQLVLPVLVA